MDKIKYAAGERGLAERLRREAEASHPAFSEELHQRICLVVEQGDLPSPPRERTSPIGRRLWTSVAATLLLVGSVLLGWQLKNLEVAQPEMPQPEGVENDTSLAMVSAELGGLSDVTNRTTDGALRMDSALTTKGWAHLDHDARLATELVLNQFPLDMLVSNSEP